MTTATATRRFGYMTNSIEHLNAARALAAPAGFAVDMLPLGAPAPEPGGYDGIVVDLAAAAGHALARKRFLEKLARLAKLFPVLVCDLRTTYQEAATLRAAGIKWLPVFKAKAFEMLLAHPLAKTLAEGEPAACEGEGAASVAE